MAYSALEMEWQRKLDPGNYAKSRNAYYHTAPAVEGKDSKDRPKDAPEGSITISFFMTPGAWMGGAESVTVDHPFVVMKDAKGKSKVKFRPVFFMDATAVYAHMEMKENYYYAAFELAKHEVVRCKFMPGKRKENGEPGSVRCVATFMP